MMKPLMTCGVLLSALPGCETVNVEVAIAAEPAAVWKVLADASSYKEWNPAHVLVEGTFREGAQVKIHLKSPDGKVSAFDSTVRRMVPERELNQGGGTPGIFTFNHTFSLKPVEGGTLLTQREEFRGIGVLFFDLGWVEAAYRAVNAAVKQRSEALASRAGGPAR